MACHVTHYRKDHRPAFFNRFTQTGDINPIALMNARPYLLDGFSRWCSYSMKNSTDTMHSCAEQTDNQPWLLLALYWVDPV